ERDRSRAGVERDRHVRPHGGPVHQGRGSRPGRRAVQVGARRLPDDGGRFRDALAAPPHRAQRAARGRRPVRRVAMTHLFAFCPRPPGWRLDWEEMDRQYPWIGALAGCPQDPQYHAEGDVWVHTRMVLEELTALPAWRSLPEALREDLFAAAVLH